MKAYDLVVTQRYGAGDDVQLAIVVSTPSAGGNDSTHFVAVDATTGQRITFTTAQVVATIPCNS